MYVGMMVTVFVTGVEEPQESVNSVRWLMAPVSRIPLGKVVMFAGKPEMGGAEKMVQEAGGF